MPAPPVTLFVEGMRGTVFDAMLRLKAELPEGSIVWIDDDMRFDPDADDDREYGSYQGFVGVDVEGVDRRTEAIPAVIKAVDAVDPDHEIVTGGDIFKRRL